MRIDHAQEINQKTADFVEELRAFRKLYQAELDRIDKALAWLDAFASLEPFPGDPRTPAQADKLPSVVAEEKSNGAV